MTNFKGLKKEKWGMDNPAWTRCWLIGAFLFALLLNGLVSAAPAVDTAQNFQVESGPGITPTETSDVSGAAEETARFFQELGLSQDRPVTIVLTRDRNAFLTETARRFGISDWEARRVTRSVDALAGDGLIVLNADGVPTPRQRTFLIAHELTHQYQRQLAGLKAGEVKWMLEGMAEAVGAYVVARQGFMTVPQYKANWYTGISRTSNKPALEALRTSGDWAEALSIYGAGMTYKTAGLSNLVLFEQHGIQQVICYFALLGKGQNATEAFQNAFEADLQQFEQSVDRWLRKAS